MIDREEFRDLLYSIFYGVGFRPCNHTQAARKNPHVDSSEYTFQTVPL